MTYQEILEKIKLMHGSVGDFAQYSLAEYNTPTATLGECKTVEQYGGTGKGNTWYSVKHFPDHDVYIKVSGYYSSYGGPDFEDWEDACKEVRPVEKTITIYEAD